MSLLESTELPNRDNPLTIASRNSRKEKEKNVENAVTFAPRYKSLWGVKDIKLRPTGDNIGYVKKYNCLGF